MKFYLGTDDPTWLRRLRVPLMLSRRQLAKRKSFPRANVGWALDSGAFSELRLHGGWTIGAREYVADVRRIAEGVGNMEWAAQQDWMCEEVMLKRTGLTVAEHQRRTVANYLELRSIAPDLPIVPVLQGYTLTEYMHCIDLFERHGVSLVDLPLVGLGSVCRRQRMNEAGELVRALSNCGLKLHGFGVKQTGLRQFGHLLHSSDSMAWCFAGWRTYMSHPGREHNCAHCQWYALMWRSKCVDQIEG